MINEVVLKRAIVVVLSTAMFTGTGIAYAFGFCNTSNASKSRVDYRDRDDYYGDPRVDSGYGYRGRNYGYGSQGYGYGAPQPPVMGTLCQHTPRRNPETMPYRRRLTNSNCGSKTWKKR